eukprot:3939492-Rhodomonas_salina.2
MSWKGGGREGGKSNHTHTYTHTWATGNLLGLRQSQIQRQRQRQRHGHIKKEETSPLRETAKDNQSGERERERRGVVHLHSSLGPSLHYGGHDSYPQDPSFPPQAMAERQIRVSPAQSPSFSTGMRCPSQVVSWRLVSVCCVEELEREHKIETD